MKDIPIFQKKEIIRIVSKTGWKYSGQVLEQTEASITILDGLDGKIHVISLDTIGEIVFDDRRRD